MTRIGSMTIILPISMTYQKIFKEPWGLPPIRTHNHFIPFKEKAQLINLRPYTYSSRYKGKVEKNGSCNVRFRHYSTYQQ
jgi:hypothetical protein